jgi:hypothetical protein
MRTGLDWYARNPKKFLGGVQGLTARQIAVYNVVIDLIYLYGGGCNNDPKWIAGYVSDMGSAAVRNVITDLIERGLIRRSGKYLTTDIPSDAPTSLSARPAIPSGTRAFVMERDGAACVYCGVNSGPMEIDHILPWSRGGEHSPENLTVACRPCNRSKRDRTPEEMGWSHG